LSIFHLTEVAEASGATQDSASGNPAMVLGGA
jgi:hypothetical protein